MRRERFIKIAPMLILVVLLAAVAGCGGDSGGGNGGDNTTLPAGGGTLDFTTNGGSYSIGASATQSWAFTTTKTTHTLAISGLGSDLAMEALSADGAMSLGVCDNFADTTTESCPVNFLFSGMTFRLDVVEKDGVASHYTITVDL